jgi:hypothetical protein
MHVYTAEGEWVAGRAWLFILGRLGWPKTTAFLAIPPMVWVVEAACSVVASDHAS